MPGREKNSQPRNALMHPNPFTLPFVVVSVTACDITFELPHLGHTINPIPLNI
jgi:hypothetical protein